MTPHHQRTRLLRSIAGALVVVGVTAASAFAHGTAEEILGTASREIAEHPGDPELYVRRAQLEFDHGDWIACLRDLDAAERLHPTSGPARLLRARALRRSGQYSEALTILGPLAAAQPRVPSILQEKARVLAALGRHSEAAEEFSRAIRRTPHPEPDEVFELTDFLLRAGRPSTARGAIQRALAHSPGTASLLQRAAQLDAFPAPTNSEPTPTAAATAPAATRIGVTTRSSGTLTRGPYLQKAAPDRITIRWRSSLSVPGRVLYGTNPADLTSVIEESTAATDHAVELTSLTPGTTYYYAVGSSTDVLASGSEIKFTTPPLAGTAVPTRIWVLGDAGTANSNQIAVRDAFTTWTGSRDPDLVLQLGDNAYNSGFDGEYQAAVFNIYTTLLGKVPFWSCLGNHETAQATAFVDTYPYFSIYTFPTAGECGGLPSGTEHYYSFDYGSIHFISLDSMTASRSATGAMATWLQADLAATTATWIVCFFHHPPYSKGSHNSDTETELIQMRQNILPILEAGGVDLVLGGHSHCYERSYLLDSHYGLSSTLTPEMKKNAGDGRTNGTGAYVKPLTGPRDHFGAVYSVAGSAGQTSGGTLNHPAHFISLNQLGSLVLDIDGPTLTGTFVRSTGTTPDTFTIVKHGAADSDGDGIPDDYELTHGLDRHTASDATADRDSDGNSELLEYLLGLDPDHADRFAWTASREDTTGFFDVSYPTLTGRSYRVLWSDDLATWQPAGAPITGDGTVKLWIDDGRQTGTPPSLVSSRYYRLEVSPAP